MCGRYALALRPSQVRRMLQEDDMPVDDAPEDDGPQAPRQSYNFAPGYHGIVYRADVPDWGAGPARDHASSSSGSSKNSPAAAPPPTAADATASPDHSRYVLQSMKWGLVPFWTRRNPDYGAVLKTINCRDDSLAGGGGGGGMWSTMKARKRCVVVAQGFYEWLRVGPKEKVPHFVRRADGRLMCFAGLWDCVRYESGGEGEEAEREKHYTYTIITTDSNSQLKFLHDRMPVILDPGSDAVRTWLDPGRYEWSRELQALLRPFEGQLEVYPVSKEVGKVGNNSPSFVVPVASRENKSNIANFFAKAGGKKGMSNGEKVKAEVEVEKKAEEGGVVKETKTVEDLAEEADDVEVKVETEPEVNQGKQGKKREAEPPLEDDEPPAKKGPAVVLSPAKKEAASPVKKQLGRGKISATSNAGKSPAKSPAKAKGGKIKAEEGSQKITKFFANSA